MARARRNYSFKKKASRSLDAREVDKVRMTPIQRAKAISKYKGGLDVLKVIFDLEIKHNVKAMKCFNG